MLRWQKTKQYSPDICSSTYIFHLLGDSRTSWNNPHLLSVCPWVYTWIPQGALQSSWSCVLITSTVFFLCKGAASLNLSFFESLRLKFCSREPNCGKSHSGNLELQITLPSKVPRSFHLFNCGSNSLLNQREKYSYLSVNSLNYISCFIATQNTTTFISDFIILSCWHVLHVALALFMWQPDIKPLMVSPFDFEDKNRSEANAHDNIIIYFCCRGMDLLTHCSV